MQLSLFGGKAAGSNKTSSPKGGATSTGSSTAVAAGLKLPTVTGRMFLTDTGQWFNVDKISIDYINKRSANPYYITKKSNLTNQIFTGAPKVEIFNPMGEVDPELTAIATGMCNSMVEYSTDAPTSLYHSAQTAFSSLFDGGCAIFEPVWATYNGWVVLYSLNYLPLETFVELPKGYNNSPAQLLKGLVLNPTTQKIEYWQKQDDGESYQITNVLHIKSPVSRDLAGDALSMPILPIIDILNYLIDILRMKAGRVGAPSIFVEMLDSDDETLAAAQDIITNWGVKTQFAHNDRLRVYTVDIKEGGGVEEAINQFESVLDAMYNPAAMIQKEGTRLGGSDAAAERLIYTQANTFLGWLEVGFTSLLQKWLILNGFDLEYTAKVTFPKLEPDKSTQKIEKVRAGFETQTLSRSERRAELEASPETPEIAAELDKEFGGGVTGDITIPGKLKNVTPQKKGSLVKDSAEINSYVEPIANQTASDLINAEVEFESVIYAAMGIKA